jgi:hypothetical protein
MRGSSAVVVAAIVVGGCGSGSGHDGTGHVPTVRVSSASWMNVGACLERHPSFTGNVAGDDKSGPGGRGTLSVEGSGGELANAYRFKLANAYRFKSHAAAVASERGIGPPGPTVTLYGDIALEVDPRTSQGDAAAITQCFSHAYG